MRFGMSENKESFLQEKRDYHKAAATAYKKEYAESHDPQHLECAKYHEKLSKGDNDE